MFMYANFLLILLPSYITVHSFEFRLSPERIMRLVVWENSSL